MCLCICVIELLSSCSNTKYLSSNQSLLTDVKVDLKANNNLTAAQKTDLKNSLISNSIMLQHPNTRLLNILRLKLWLYNQKYSERKTSKLWNLILIKKNMEPPVVYDSVKTLQTIANMTSYLNNQGYFYASVNFKQHIKNRKVSLNYQVNTGKNFVIDSINYEIQDPELRDAVLRVDKYSLLKKNTPFQYSTLGEEQTRIANAVRNAGYYKFSRDHVRFVADTLNKVIFSNYLDPFSNIQNVIKASQSSANPTLNLTIQIQNPSDSTRYQKYYIHQINVYPDYSIYSDVNDSSFHVKKYGDLIIHYQDSIIKSRVLKRSIFLKTGTHYSLEDYNRTLSKLNDLGIWKFVTIQLDTVAGNPDQLNCFVYLTPGKKQSLGADLESTTSSDYVIGGAVNLTYKNNNLNKAANLLTASLKTGVEWNSDSTRAFFVQAREVSASANISFPRFILPWHLKTEGQFSNPHTNLSTGLYFLDRLGFFTMQNYNGSFGYNWNETKYKKWIVTPFSFEYNHIFNISRTFQSQLSTNPLLLHSFSSTFMGGESVSFIFNNQDPLHSTSFDYFRSNLDESGLLLGGVDGLMKGISAGHTDFSELTSINFSQYVKLDAEYKHYIIRPHASLIGHLYAGVAVPYGRSDVIPYIKQFSAGGPNSMRAWRLRSLGPGAYRDTGVASAALFPDQTGDMKLEGNLEYRFDIFKMFGGFMMLKGALFLDAGNIWNLQPDPYKPGSTFQFAKFYPELALGGGAGLRLDFTYAVIRLDLATPLKEPYPVGSDGWTIRNIAPFSKNWRKDNLIFNFAVGYPF